MADDEPQPPDELPPEDAVPSAEELEALRAQAARAEELEDRLKRAQAEFVNESRRIQRQAEQERRYANEGLIKDLVHVVEHFDQALKVSRAAGSAAAGETSALREGVALVLK